MSSDWQQPGGGQPPPPPPPAGHPPVAPPPGPTSVPPPPPGPNYQAPGAYPYPPQQPAGTDGRLIASGVLSLISAAVVALFAGLFLWLAIQFDQMRDDDFFGDDIARDLATGIGVVLVLITVLYLLSGIGCVKGRNWGRVLTFVVQGLALLVLVAALFVDGFDAGVLVPIAWSALILGLAIAGKPR